MDRSRARLFVLGVLVLSLVGTLLGRLWYVQVLAGPTYRAQAAANEVRTVVTSAPRGSIVDDEGRPLADDHYEYVVTVDADTLSQQKDEGKAVLARLAPVVGESVTDLTDKIRSCGAPVPGHPTQKVTQPCYTGSPYQPVPVKVLDPTDTAGLQKAFVVAERSQDFPGVAISQQQVRQYPYGALAGQELGYLSAINAQQLTEPAYAGYQASDLVGQSGLEEQYDKQLRGTDAVTTLSVDSAGDVTGTLKQTQPVAGDTLVTNLDAGAQNALEQELVNVGIKTAQSNGKFGSTAAGVIMNAKTGAVYALASVPDYDPNEFTGGISTANYAALENPDASAPLISRAYSASFPPGSTFKISSAATILQNNLATASTPVECGSSFKLGNQTFHNFEGEAKGEINLIQALQYSCDIYFYTFAAQQWYDDGGLRIPPPPTPAKELFAHMALDFGYGKPTGIDLPGESSGILYDRAVFAAAVKNEQKQACIGATTHPTDPAREAADKTLCDTPAAEAEALQGGDAIDFAIGQGGQVNVTLLQQAVAYAAIANGGTKVVPQIAKAFISPAGVATPVAPKTAGKIPVSAANIASIQAGFNAVTHLPGGTGEGLFPAQLDVSGKSGTADVAATGVLANEPESWFASYWPATNPQFVMVIMIEHGSQGAIEAGRTSAAVINDLYGLAGKKAVWPGGQPPTALPKISATGAITAPQKGTISVPQNDPPLKGGTPDPNAVMLAEEALTAQNAAKSKSGGSG